MTKDNDNQLVKTMFDDDDNGYTRNGVTDSTIAVTELIVLTNCLRNLQKDETLNRS